MIEVNFYSITDDRQLGSFMLPCVPRTGETVFISAKAKNLLIQEVKYVIAGYGIEGQESFYATVKGYYC